MRLRIAGKKKKKRKKVGRLRLRTFPTGRSWGDKGDTGRRQMKCVEEEDKKSWEPRKKIRHLYTTHVDLPGCFSLTNMCESGLSHSGLDDFLCHCHSFLLVAQLPFCCLYRGRENFKKCKSDNILFSNSPITLRITFRLLFKIQGLIAVICLILWYHLLSLFLSRVLFPAILASLMFPSYGKTVL